MRFEFISGLSWPGDPGKPNDDAFCHAERIAAVFDGATSLGEPILPVDSDAAWIARKGAEGLIAHGGHPPRQALARAAADAERSFLELRTRPPAEIYELPLASMMLAGFDGDALQFLWFGDCAALVRKPGNRVAIVGDAMDKRKSEAERVARLAARHKLDPAAGIEKPEYLAALRRARNLVNTTDGSWAFSPDARSAAFAKSMAIPAAAGTEILLCSDGFLALASDYGRYDVDALLARAFDSGLKLLFEELRVIERADPDGRTYPRFKTSDDATAVLLRLLA